MSTLTLRLEAYAKDAQKLITAAQSLADERQHLEVEPLHLFYRLVERDATAQGALDRSGVPAADVLVEVEQQLRRVPKLPDAVAYLSPRMLDLLGRAEGEAARAGGRPVSVADLFLASTQESTGPVAAVLRAVGLSAPILRATLAGGQVGTDATRGKFGLGPRTGETNGGATSKKGATPSGAAALTLYGTDLTQQARDGRFDPTIGRDDVLRRMLDVLARRRDHNPLLVGEAGIGKSAIVQELARRMAADDVPAMLRGKRLVSLEMGTLVAGAKLRGELEERVRALLDAVRGSGGEVLLFLPDLASLAAERGAGELVANSLAQGEVRAIATATPDAVRKSLEESSLARRFVAITVDAPTVDETVAILRGLVAKFEAAHSVRISDPALVAAASFAKRYVPGSALPRSAIDLVDEAAARTRVQLEGVPGELDRDERRLESLALQISSLADDTDPASNEARARMEKERDALAPKAKALRERWTVEKSGADDAVAKLRAELEDARRKAAEEKDEAKASSLRFGTIPLLEKQLASASAGTDGAATAPLVSNVVTEQDIADVISAWTGVPVARMLEDETAKLLKMEERLADRIVGQDAAVRAVSKAVRRGRVGLRDPRKPIGSFLFLGPTGVGKTELAKALAELLFDDETALTRLDMSEFMEKHTVARLIGSPPGYVDSDEGGFLTEAVRRKPYSVVLFDELEKAHPDVFNILLQVLDDGRLTDSRGRLAQFADTVIIMTSNVGGVAILDHEGDAESLREKTTAALRGHFRPEFLNRIDDVVIFDRLSKPNLRGIVEIQLRGLAKLLAERRLSLVVTDAAKDKLTDLGYEPAFGARPLKRVILKHLQDPLAEEILRGGYSAGDTVRVDVDAGGAITFAKG